MRGEGNNGGAAWDSHLSRRYVRAGGSSFINGQQFRMGERGQNRSSSGTGNIQWDPDLLSDSPLALDPFNRLQDLCTEE